MPFSGSEHNQRRCQIRGTASRAGSHYTPACGTQDLEGWFSRRVPAVLYESPAVLRSASGRFRLEAQAGALTRKPSGCIFP
jgi:hypothetical protein